MKTSIDSVVTDHWYLLISDDKYLICSGNIPQQPPTIFTVSFLAHCLAYLSKYSNGVRSCRYSDIDSLSFSSGDSKNIECVIKRETNILKKLDIKNEENNQTYHYKVTYHKIHLL